MSDSPTHRVTIVGSDVAFDCGEHEPVLDAALRAGIELPYSCRKGVCGNCAGSVVAGEVASAHGLPLANGFCAPGQQLLCGCAPRSALQIAPASWQRIDPTARKRLTARVFRNELVAPDVSLLQLRLPAGQRVKFRAGQYLQVRLPDGSVRSYSMANPPQESDGVTLHIRHVPGGVFSARVPGLQRGDLLEIELPFGDVPLAADDARPIVFVAGGTGFAPVKSIVDDFVRRRVERPVTVIWGARVASGLYLRSAVERWQAGLPTLRFVPALSEDPQAEALGAFAGRADEALLASCPSLAGHVLYCCGAPAMVVAVRHAAVTDCGLAPADFHADVFVEGPSVAPT